MTTPIRPADVAPGQTWAHKVNGLCVRVINVDSRYAIVRRIGLAPGRSWQIERAGLCARYTPSRGNDDHTSAPASELGRDHAGSRRPGRD